MGWQHSVAGGQGNLIAKSLQSPNFNIAAPLTSPTPSWALLQTGIAYLFGLVITGGTISGPDYIINTSGIFIYSGTPANGNLIGTWAGAAGTDAFGNAYPQGFSVTKGAISGTVFSGTNFIINSAGAFFYSGAPAAGTLIASIAPAAGTDAFGNAYIGGMVTYASVGASGYEAMQYQATGLIRYTSPLPGGAAGPYASGDLIRLDATGILLNSSATTVAGAIQLDGTITLNNGGTSTIAINSGNGHPVFSKEIELADASAPSTPGTGTKVYSATGQLKYVSEDGGVYATGSIRSSAAGQTVATAAFVNLTGLALALGANAYQIRLRLFLNANTSAGQFQIEMTAPGGTTGNYSFKWESAAGVSGLNVNRTTFALALGGPAASVAGAYWVTLEGVITLSAAGAVIIKGLDTGTPGTDTWAVETGSYFEAFPLV